jgi:hypothetical protein
MKARKKKKNEVPKTKFCWSCGRKFQGNHFTVLEYEDGDYHRFDRYVHISCVKEYDPSFK